MDSVFTYQEDVKRKNLKKCIAPNSCFTRKRDVLRYRNKKLQRDYSYVLIILERNVALIHANIDFAENVSHSMFM
jgi:hypothetical protein